MKRNIGTIDMVARGMLGFAFVVYLFKDGSLIPGSTAGLVIGSYLLGTAIFSFDPLYRLLGFTSLSPLDRSI